MPRATKSKKKATGKSRKSRTNPIDPKLARYAELIHDALTGKEPVATSVKPEQYLEMFEILGLLSRDAKGRDVGAAARSKDKLKRMAAAMHPAATKGTLQLLADDKEPMIQNQAMARLVELAT